MGFHDENKMIVDVYFHDCFDVSDAGQTVVAYLKTFMTHILMNRLFPSLILESLKTNPKRGTKTREKYPEQSIASIYISYIIYASDASDTFPGNRAR